MSNINQDLQATHKILTIIEQSKTNNDELLDHLPGIFCIIDDQARVLRGNLELARIFKIDLEDLIEKDFKSIFSKEIWNIFQSKIDHYTKVARRYDMTLKIKSLSGALGAEVTDIAWAEDVNVDLIPRIREALMHYHLLRATRCHTKASIWIGIS